MACQEWRIPDCHSCTMVGLQEQGDRVQGAVGEGAECGEGGRTMTDKKTKKEKPSYDIEIIRRATVDADFNYYELKAIIDPAKIDGVTAIRDIEKIVTFARELTAPKESKPSKKAPKISTKKSKVPEGYKEVPQSSEDIKISELQAGDKVNINVRFEKAGEVKSFISKVDGSAGKFVKVDVADASGTMKLTLFGDQCDLIKDIKENAWLQIENAYCKEYQGNLELSIAYGKMEVVYNG